MLGNSSHRRGSLLLLWWMDGCVSQRAHASRGAPVSPYEGFGCEQDTGISYGDILYVHIVEGAGTLLPTVSGQASSSQSVAGVGSELCYTSVAEEKNRAGSTPMAESGGSGEGRKSAKGTTRTRQQSTEIRE